MAKRKKEIVLRPIHHPPQELYEFEFSDDQWDELVSMSFEPFEFSAGEKLTRGQWMALAEMALGKAQRIEEGFYGMVDENDNDIGDADGVNVEEWAEQLRAIAAVIFQYFQPGDNKI